MRRILLGWLLVAAPVALAQTKPSAPDVVAPNENLVVEGIPPIPASLAESVGRYTEYRVATPLSWHPTRREMLISTRFADTPQLHLVKMPGGARTQLTFFKDRVMGGSFQPTRGDSLVYARDAGGNEFVQLHRFDFVTGESTLLTDGKSKNDPGPWSRDGTLLAYTSTRRNGADTDLYAINPADKSSDRLIAQVKGGGWNAEDWSRDNATLLVQEIISINEMYLWLFDAKTGERTAITPRDNPEKISYRHARFSADGKGIYCTTDRDNQFHRLAYIDLADKKHTYFTDDIPWDVDDLDLSDDGKTIAFTTNEDGVNKLHLLDTASGKHRAVEGMPPGVIGSLRWHKNNRDLMFDLGSARSPWDAYSLDASTGKIERWTESETGGLNPQTFAEPQLVRWTSFDGRKISGFLYRPSAEKFPGKRPVVINIHGGPEGQYQPSYLARLNYYINELGVAIIFPNVRGSSGYGKEFLTLDNGMKRLDSVKDVGALLDWIKDQPDLDADRVMVTGGSYGGYMTLAVATMYNDRIRCAVDVVGISNFVTFLEHTESYRRDLRRVEYGDERDPAMRAFLNETAPLNNAGKITKPLFVVQGRNDPRVPWTEARQMVDTVRKNGSPVWFLMANDEGHGFAKKRNVDFQVDAMVLFMREFLLK